MKRVLIADDELLVRIGLKSTISWEENGFVVVGEAKNGREAVELFEKFDPDILLTDIRMPVMNGLELIQELKARKSSLKAVILTHYDDFNYAKEAIKLGASEYILKSDLSQENLLTILNRLSDEIGRLNENDIQANSHANNEKFNDADNVDRLFRRIVAGDYKSKQELAGILIKIKTFFKHRLYAVAVAKVFTDHLNELMHELEREGIKKSIENVSNQVFTENYISQIFCFNDDEIFYLLNIEGIQDSKKITEKVKNQVALLKKNIMQFLEIDMNIGLSNVSESYENIPKLLEKARTALDYCYFEPSGVVVFDEGIGGYEAGCPKIHLDTIRNYIKTFEKGQLSDYIDNIFEELFKLKNISFVREVFIDFLSYAKVIAAELNLKNHPAFSEQKLSYMYFEKLQSFEMAKKYITDIFYELMDRTDENKSAKYSFIISKCIDYIRNNYHKNISLTDVADSVQISKSYLSLLFKQETGINFSSFLANYRIEKSKKLLRESNYKIYEIAEKVGFDNPYYFSKVFKEVTGISCKEFKKSESIN